MPKLRSLEICGFRSFAGPQSLSFDTNLALIWASNSQGKTSIAEAVEFLFTGSTNRRELLGGAKAEFESSLRNVHLAKSAPVWVKAEIVDSAGLKHDVCRTLTSDYTADKDCVSELTIDGKPASDLASLGISLFEPPLRAPVLLQHSLRFALSAKPSDRADYFKGLLEVQDLDRLVDLIAAGVARLQPAPGELILRLRRLSEVADLSKLASEIEASNLRNAEIEQRLRRAVVTGLTGIGEDVSETESLAEQANRLHQALEARRESSFPVNDYSVGAAVPAPAKQPFDKLRAYAEIARTVDAEVESLRSVFEAVLAVPVLADLDHLIDCPVCETPNALTPERVAAMRAQVAESKGLRAAQTAARNEIDTSLSGLGTIGSASARLVPSFASLEGEDITSRENLVTELTGEADLHRAAMETAVALSESTTVMDEVSKTLRTALDDAKSAVARAEVVDADKLEQLATDLSDALTAMAAPRTSCVDATEALLAPVREAVDKRQGLSHWRELTELTGDIKALCGALRDERTRAIVRSDFEGARREIGNAKLKVFDDKFSGMSSEITRWWQLLRPDEPVHFEAVRRRGEGKRFVSFKARLRPQLGAAGVERDALGVFSDSQLNALGLAAFLARAKLQESPLILLDDPLLAGDSDHRATFVTEVLHELLENDVQVIVLSFDDMTKRLMHNRYESLPVDGFLVTMENPANGSIVAKTSDTADALLQQAAVHLNSDHVAVRRAGAQALRLAAERLAKEILVKQRLSKGEECSLEDYEGKMLGSLITSVTPFMTDTADPGKWKTVNNILSPGSHDAPPPTRTDLKVAHGDLRRFYKTYIKP